MCTRRLYGVDSDNLKEIVQKMAAAATTKGKLVVATRPPRPYELEGSYLYTLFTTEDRSLLKQMWQDTWTRVQFDYKEGFGCDSGNFKYAPDPEKKKGLPHTPETALFTTVFRSMNEIEHKDSEISTQAWYAIVFFIMTMILQSPSHAKFVYDRSPIWQYELFTRHLDKSIQDFLYQTGPFYFVSEFVRDMKLYWIMGNDPLGVFHSHYGENGMGEDGVWRVC